MNVTVLDQAKPDALRLLDCMEVLDQMRAKLMSGELSGFAAVALNAAGECTGWVAHQAPADVIERLWENSGHGTRREDVEAAYQVGAAAAGEAWECALRTLRDAVIAQNRAGASWHPHVFAQMMAGLARASALLDKEVV